MWARGATLLLVLPAAAFDSRTTHATLLEADVVALRSRIADHYAANIGNECSTQ